MTMLNLGKDIKGVVTYSLPFSENKVSVTLPTAGAVSLTVPVTATNWEAHFSYEGGSNVWVANNATAAAPAGATFAATTSERNPVARDVKAGDVLSFYTNDTGVEMGVTFYVRQ
jgi:hypothetical protein